LCEVFQGEYDQTISRKGDKVSIDTDKQTTVIEINGVKLEVDLRTAKRIDTLRIGDRVKCLRKEYEGWKTCPGVVIGFEPFKNLPSIVVAYLDGGYNSDILAFKTYNAETKDFEIVPDLDHNALVVNKGDIIAKFDRDIAKKQAELDEIETKRAYFLSHFGRYFTEEADA
jgi:hypothetical protein